MRSIIVTVTAVGTALAAAGGTLAAQPDLLRHPTAALSAAGPDSFTVRVFTTKGPVALLSRRAWSPRGSDRFYHLVRLKFYDRSVFYRVLPNYIAQVGYHRDPAVTAAWDDLPIKDDKGGHPNKKGTVTFARAGANSRTTQIFFNLADNANLDDLGFTPFAEVTDGMDALAALNGEYGEVFPRGNGPKGQRIALEGHAYLKKEFPALDAIDSARITERWPAAKGAAKPSNR